jgi:hypothetical protein
MLLLPTEGGVPGLPGGGVKATKVDCIAVFGPAKRQARTNSMAVGRGSLQYKLYTKELMEQIHQEVVDNANILLYQFARGLLDEEN